MLLILVDGKKTGKELVQMAASMGETAQLVEQLEAEGLIEAVGTAARSTVDAPVLSAPGDLTKVKLLATKLLVEQLGPMADAMALRLENAKDVTQFIDAMKRAYAAVREVKGAAVADHFGAQVEAELTRT